MLRTTQGKQVVTMLALRPTLTVIMLHVHSDFTARGLGAVWWAVSGPLAAQIHKRRSDCAPCQPVPSPHQGLPGVPQETPGTRHLGTTAAGGLIWRHAHIPHSTVKTSPPGNTSGNDTNPQTGPVLAEVKDKAMARHPCVAFAAVLLQLRLSGAIVIMCFGGAGMMEMIRIGVCDLHRHLGPGLFSDPLPKV